MVKEERKFRVDRYLKKIYRKSTETVCIKSFTSFLLCKRASYTPGMASFLKNPDVAFDRPGSTILKRGNSATVVRFKVDGLDFVVKRYNVKNHIHALKRAFKKSRADRSWRGAHLLLEYGIKTPKPVALKEIRLGPFRNRAYLICDYVEGISARDYFKAPQSKGEREPAHKIIRIFERLKSLQVSHGDMKDTNIIIQDGEPFLIDLDSMTAHKSRARFARARCKDVSRFMKNWDEKPGVAVFFRLMI
jgi:tRNA A-37 threonylcarbamoyl transferase component Bud32